MHERKRGLLARFNAFLRGVLLTCAVVVGGLLVVWLAVRSQVNDEIRREVERRFAQRYRDFRVSVRHARMFEGRGVEIHGLSITRREDNRPLVCVDEVFAACKFDAESLLAGEQPRTEHVYVSGLKLSVERQADGSWDIQRLWPLPEFGSSHAARDGPRRKRGVDRPGRRRPPHAEPAQRLPGNRAPAANGHAGSRQQGSPVAARCACSGRLDGEHFQRRRVPGATRHGSLRLERVRQSAGTAMVALSCTRRCRMDLQQQLAPACTVSGRLDLEFRVGSGRPPSDPIDFLVKGSLAEGQVQDSRLPYRLYDVRAQLELDNHHLRLDQAFARNGNSTVTLQLERRGWQDNSPLTLMAQTRRLELESRFLEVLPQDLQALWRKYFPAGNIDAELRLDFDGRRWTPELAIICHDVSFAYHRFPYRLERGRGTMQLKDNRLQIDLTAAASGQDVTIRGDVVQPRSRVSRAGSNSVASSRFRWTRNCWRRLVDPKAREVVRSLRPSGMLAVQGRFERTDPNDPELHRRVQIELFNCSLNYERFPYPLGMIRGRLLWDDQGWTFQDLTGRNDTAYVEGTGFWRRTPDAGSELVLNLVGTDVPLEDELRDALQPGAQRLWNQLRPRGTVDHLQVDIHYASARPVNWPSRSPARNGRESPTTTKGHSITILPTWFPYRLDEVAGHGAIQQRPRSSCGTSPPRTKSTQVSISGACGIAPDGSWTVQLPNVIADRIYLNRDLLAALPKELGKAVERLNLHGDLCLQGSLAFLRRWRRRAPHGGLGPHRRRRRTAACSAGFPSTTCTATSIWSARSGNGSFSSRGELNVDSVMYRDIQLTGVTGPLTYRLVGHRLRDRGGRRCAGPPAAAAAGQRDRRAVVGGCPRGIRAGNAVSRSGAAGSRRRGRVLAGNGPQDRKTSAVRPTP